MFENIREVTFKINDYCNLDCEYCFQKHDVKEQHEGFTDYEALLHFMKKLPLDQEYIEFKITGGESSLCIDKIRDAYKVLKKLERFKKTKVIFSTISNGTNMDGLLGLMDDGILNPDYCKISYDGIYSATKSRKVKKNKSIYTDKFFNDQIALLGSSNYGSHVLVRTALTNSTIDDLSESLKFIVSTGCKQWEYYYISDYPMYKEKEFQDKFYLVLPSLISTYEDNDFSFYNYETWKYTQRADNDYRLTMCRHLGRFLYIDDQGYIYPCGYFSPDGYYEEEKFCIGHITKGFDRERLEAFSKEYFERPSCAVVSDNKCAMTHCFECPAVSHYRYNKMNIRSMQQCHMRLIEHLKFKHCKKKLNLTDLDKVMTPYNLGMESGIPDNLPYMKNSKTKGEKTNE